MEDVLSWTLVIVAVALAAALVIPIVVEFLILLLGLLAFAVTLLIAPFVMLYRKIRS